MAKIIVGMSGGVDSAVAAYLLKQAGHEVTGVTLRTWLTDSRCCEIDDARRTAQKLDIPYYVLNVVADFTEKVTKPFMESYICGMTPNPCVGCNRLLKWEGMLSAADMMGADYVATGHYASVVHLDNGRVTVKKASHAKKDQTYMLYRLSQEQLRRTVMPLGEYSKDQVRGIAGKIGLEVAGKPDSQEICFVTEGHYADYIEENYEGEIPGEGNFVDEQGRILGRHRGIIHYTVGQRKGLGVAFGHPVYVKEINAERNEVVLGEEESLYRNTVICRDVNFLSIPGIHAGEKIRCRAKIRYQHPAQEAVLERLDEESVRLTFDQPVRAATPGQAAVFYDGDDCVIGGGTLAYADSLCTCIFPDNEI